MTPNRTSDKNFMKFNRFIKMKMREERTRFGDDFPKQQRMRMYAYEFSFGVSLLLLQINVGERMSRMVILIITLCCAMCTLGKCSVIFQ